MTQPVSCSCRLFGLLDWAARPRVSVNCLKGAAYAESKDALFLAKEEWKTINNLVFPRVGIISINKTKRHVENRYLEADLGAHTSPDVGELREQTFIKADYGICLRIATQKYREEAKGQTYIVDRSVAKGLIEFGLRDNAVVTRDQRINAPADTCQVREVTARSQRIEAHARRPVTSARGCVQTRTPANPNRSHKRG